MGSAGGLAGGEVRGARAGRRRDGQIEHKAQQVWELDPVQKRVDRVTEVGRSAGGAVPGVVGGGGKRVVKAINEGDSAGDKLDNATAEGKKVADDVRKAAERDARKVADASAAADS